MKLDRKALLHYVDASMGKDIAEYFLVGKDIEDMSVDLGASVEVTENILGETSVRDNGYEPTINVTPYYANPDDAIYAPLQNIAMNRLKGDACKTKYLEVIIEDTEAEKHKAWVEDCILKPTSYGGGRDGVNIPYTIYPNGNRKEVKVTIDPDTKAVAIAD